MPEPVTGDHVPAGHEEALEAPTLSQKWPMGQDVHVEEDTAATAVDNVPMGHRLHSEAELGDQDPAPQS